MDRFKSYLLGSTAAPGDESDRGGEDPYLLPDSYFARPKKARILEGGGGTSRTSVMAQDNEDPVQEDLGKVSSN